MINNYKIKTDVLVLGSGPAGFAAAYTAAKNGADVIIVEQSGDIGGISTSGMMSHWTGTCGSPLYYEILRRSAELNDGEQKGYTIPYRCLLPEVKENLLLCGRNISGTHIAHSNFRVMPICVGIGEAAGTAAAISVKKNCALTDITANEIRKMVGI